MRVRVRKIVATAAGVPAAALIALAGAVAFAPRANATARLLVGSGARLARAAADQRAGVRLAALSEESLPPEELPSPAATPGAGAPAPAPGAAGAAGAASGGAGAAASPAPSQGESAGDEWTRVPAGGAEAAGSAGAQPPASAGASAGAASSGPQMIVVPPPQAPAATAPAQAGAAAPGAGAGAEAGAYGAAPPANGATSSAVAGGGQGSAPAPEASAAQAPPPYDVGSVQPAPPVSDQPLTALIDAAAKDQPALSASLRFVEQARQALDASKADDAIRALGRAVSIDPTEPYAYFYLGRAYMTKGDYAQSLAFFSRSEVGLRGTPAWLGEVKSFEGACLEQQGKFAQAAQAYKDALDAAPNNLRARVGYGRLTTVASDANAGNEPPPPAPAVGAAVPAPDAGAAAPPPEDGTAVAEPPDEPPPAPAQSGATQPGKSSDQPGDN